MNINNYKKYINNNILCGIIIKKDYIRFLKIEKINIKKIKILIINNKINIKYNNLIFKSLLKKKEIKYILTIIKTGKYKIKVIKTIINNNIIKLIIKIIKKIPYKGIKKKYNDLN